MNQPQQSVLITGGALRIGREIALHFAQKGWNVAIHYQRSRRASAHTLVQRN
jgi:NAD(P)-dependent dehydrogenase (short-subunit alcohol dehydrogenase family)